jgi:hypothetical protein
MPQCRLQLAVSSSGIRTWAAGAECSIEVKAQSLEQSLNNAIEKHASTWQAGWAGLMKVYGGRLVARTK